MVSGAKNNNLVKNSQKIYKEIMASEQIMNEAIARAVAEATRIELQAVAEALVGRMHDGSGPKVGSPVMKQPTFDWNVQDKYSELKLFWLEVKNILSTYKPHKQTNWH